MANVRKNTPKRIAQLAQMERAWSLVKEGMAKRDFAEAVGFSRDANIESFLVTMERNGFRLWEENGRIGKMF